jgi:hypothetical protein
MRFAGLGGCRLDRLNTGKCFAYALTVEPWRKNAAEGNSHLLSGTGGKSKTCGDDGDASMKAPRRERSLNRYASA